MTLIIRVLLLSSIALLGACISYTDPKVKNLDESQYAIIFVEIGIKVETIDGKRVPLNWFGPIDELKLSPGEHTFKIIWDNIYIKTEPLTFSATLEAGEQYDLKQTTDETSKTWSFEFKKKQR